MEPNPYRPRVSRETRLLLTTGLLAVVALWVLARVRFPERPVTANPVPPFFTQLTSGPTYDELALEIAQLQPRLEPALILLDGASAVGETFPANPPPKLSGLRLRAGLAIALLPARSKLEGPDDSGILARDPASGLAVVRVPIEGPQTLPSQWEPRGTRQPRYFVGSDVTREGVALRPVFVGALDSIVSPVWPQPIWSMPANTDLAPGTFLFTSNAELVGLVVEHEKHPALVPAAVVLAEAERLLAGPVARSGPLGIEVQGLTPALAAATGVATGVVVTFVDGAGAASDRLMVGDVIESVDGVALSSPDHWRAIAARLPAGSPLTLVVYRHKQLQKVELVPPPPPEAVNSESLGLTLRPLRGVGSQVVGVERGSAAARAGLAIGDTITLIAGVRAPAPDQIHEAYAIAPPGQPVMVAVSRGDAHHVTTLAK
jgi:hypothetical protein